MVRPKQPIAVVQAKGKKHLSKEEIKQRENSEVKPCIDNIEPPSYLTKTQKKEFTKIADQLKKLKVMGETDVDTLARYITSNDIYIKIVRKLRKTEVKDDLFALDSYTKIQDRVFKQCRACANDLGLTISSRCRLVIPVSNDPPKPKNKFDKFKKG